MKKNLTAKTFSENIFTNKNRIHLEFLFVKFFCEILILREIYVKIYTEAEFFNFGLYTLRQRFDEPCAETFCVGGREYGCVRFTLQEVVQIDNGTARGQGSG